MDSKFSWMFMMVDSVLYSQNPCSVLSGSHFNNLYYLTGLILESEVNKLTLKERLFAGLINISISVMPVSFFLSTSDPALRDFVTAFLSFGPASRGFRCFTPQLATDLQKKYIFHMRFYSLVDIT